MIETLVALALVVIGIADGDTLIVQDGDVKTVKLGPKGSSADRDHLKIPYYFRTEKC